MAKIEIVNTGVDTFDPTPLKLTDLELGDIFEIFRYPDHVILIKTEKGYIDLSSGTAFFESWFYEDEPIYKYIGTIELKKKDFIEFKEQELMMRG